MQIETYIIVFGLLAGWIATAAFLHKAVKKAYVRGLNSKNEIHNEQMEGLRQDLHHQVALRQAESVRLQPACTLADHELLTDIGTTLRIAAETWQAFPGTETMLINVAQQRRQLTAFAAKMWVAAYPAQLNVEDAA